MKETNPEALEWLTSNGNVDAFASNHFGNTKYSISFVKELYKHGAKRVEISGIFKEEWRIKHEGGEYADTLLIYLPKSKTKRLALVPIVVEQHPDEMDGDWNGNEPIELWWD